MKKFLLLFVLGGFLACGNAETKTSITTPAQDAQKVINMMKKDLTKGEELLYEMTEIYAVERGGEETKEFARLVTEKMEQLN